LDFSLPRPKDCAGLTGKKDMRLFGHCVSVMLADLEMFATCYNPLYQKEMDHGLLNIARERRKGNSGF